MTSISFSKLNSKEINQDETFDLHSELNISLLGKPIEIGHFSIDANKKMHFDKRQMKYLISDLKIGELDLNANYSPDLLFKYVTIEKLHTLLKWILHFKVKLKVDFVTVRGTVSRIMCTPYSDKTYKNNWDICATKFNGVIYLTAVDTDKELARVEEFPQLLRYMSWGYKFEQYLTTAQVDDEVDLSPRNNHEEYCIVLKNKFNDFSLLYQAEIDAVIPHQFHQPGSGDTSCYIELKTSKIIQRTSEVFNFCSIIYKFSYTGEGIVYIEKLMNPEEKYRVLPDWYKTAME